MTHVMSMAWRDLAFLHWRVDAQTLTAHLPRGLQLDTFDGSAWLGVVPFRMANVRPRGSPIARDFLELNVRTYVTAGGMPGVWFFSLDATDRLGVRVARRAFYLPYFDARMTSAVRDGWYAFESERVHRGAPRGEFAGRYRPVDVPRHSHPGSLEAFLTERYWLYSADARGRVFRGRVHHEPWPLQAAQVVVERCTLGDLVGVTLDGAPVAHFAKDVQVRADVIRRVQTSS
ncbi:YqjF family protein [Deinococcus yavapaiensis]|uniref:DUF2071 domain-containing protein n=1 Tax=Deinococcus yavapaiensis KR-236 TaxID=694435 RepID=A0A318ST59_9DEIO|nr:DUF2071 domain-containing protein [Deinococcus yavapaiensis]PYE56396.1 hypothetical protein DES52_101200 [Deinococcus yavapaiensis KR-236]